MPSQAVTISIKDETQEVLLRWKRFDGDDYFEDFRISVVAPEAEPRVYEFGPCAVRTVRKMKQFISDQNIPTVGGGFRHPDVRTYDWHRIGPDLELVVRLEGSRLEEKHVVRNPRITVKDDEA